MDIAAADSVTGLAATLGGDYLFLGGIANASAGLGALSASADVIDVTGVVSTAAVTTSGEGNVSLTATRNIGLGPGSGLSVVDGDVPLTGHRRERRSAPIGGASPLSGGPLLDWFFLSLRDSVIDPQAGETTTLV